jgi:hypothetical protein
MDIVQAIKKGRPSRRLARQLAVDGKWVELVKLLGDYPRSGQRLTFRAAPGAWCA